MAKKRDDGRRPAREFSTSEEPPFVRIDGEDYELHLAMDYSEILQHQRAAKRMLDLGAREDLVEQEEATLGDLLRTNVRIMLKAPDELLNKLNDLHRLSIVSAWNEEAVAILSSPTKAGDGRSSPGSTGSTAGA